MKPTTLAVLAKVVTVAALVTWAADSLLWQLSRALVAISAGSPTGIGLVDIALAMWAWHVKSRLPEVVRHTDGTVQVKRPANPLSQLEAARTVALALAAGRTGAALLGGYLGLAITALLHLSNDYAKSHGIVALLSAIAATVMVAIALWLERKCTLPKPPSEEQSGVQGSGEQPA